MKFSNDTAVKKTISGISPCNGLKWNILRNDLIILEVLSPCIFPVIQNNKDIVYLLYPEKTLIYTLNCWNPL